MKDKSIQEEIREGVEYTIMINRPYLASDITDKILKYLDSKNVRLLDRDIEEAGVAHMQRLVEE